tara:strand:- start:83 stop:388 length:306 start_codon:yes stop_codon:yes gene_type:complete
VEERELLRCNDMAKIRVRVWAKKCLAENGISTTEEIAEYIENRSTVGVKSVRSLGSILSSTTGIEKCGKTLVRSAGRSYYVNQWKLRQIIGEQQGDEENEY